MTAPIVEQRDGVWVVTLQSIHGEVVSENFPDEQAARNYAAWWQRTVIDLDRWRALEGLTRMRARWEATT
jgi:hypothetical protein